MKKIAVLVIAALNQPVYVHYIKTYWSELIKYTNSETPHIDVFLLFEEATELGMLNGIKDNIIVDRTTNLSQLCHPRFSSPMIPGILTKTVYALELLGDQYDVLFRTNLSSLIKVTQFNHFLQMKPKICYSGGWVWVDGLRDDLIAHNKIGVGKSIETLSELNHYPGNTFISGSGFLLSAAEAKSLVERKHTIRYDIIDDVAIGLMMSKHEVLPNFSELITPDKSTDGIMESLRKTGACHIRLHRFPLDQAEALWRKLSDDPVWK